MKYLLCTAVLFFATAVVPLTAAESSPPAAAQSVHTTQAPAGQQAKPPTRTNEKQEKNALPAEYRSIALGMNIDAVNKILCSDTAAKGMFHCC